MKRIGSLLTMSFATVLVVLGAHAISAQQKQDKYTVKVPNGLAFSVKEDILYVADSGKPRHIRAFNVRPDGTLDAGRVFATIDQGGPDGIRVDALGNVWSSSGDGAQVFSPAGVRIARVRLPESGANVGFGGADGRTLFITARTSLYAIDTLVRGAPRP